nr:RNA-directed DNA polymerase, eukaryota, reverse transcriptase zinc-binding domain protein [Tanacetum cinerariifolium]
MDHCPSRLLVSPRKVITGMNKNLLKVNCDLNVIFSRKVGDGATEAFRIDVWIGNSNLKTGFPRLYSLEVAKDCIVVDHYVFSASNGSPACFLWAWMWRRPIKDGLEMAQLQDLMGLLINNFVLHNPLIHGHCSVSIGVLNSIPSWWGMNDCPKDLQNLIRWADLVDINIKAKACFDAVIQTTT